MTAEKNPFARFLTHFEQGHVLFNDIPGNKTYAVNAEGKALLALDGSKKANGMAYGPEK